ncbi:MAG: hypothetical protein ACRDHM_10145 [Actinomycetota bacterium]
MVLLDFVTGSTRHRDALSWYYDREAAAGHAREEDGKARIRENEARRVR